MEKQKKTKVWLWIVIAAAALLIIGGVLWAVLSGVFQSKNTLKIYWNVDKSDYPATRLTDYITSRPKRKDGYYHVKMAVDGEVTDVLVADKSLINRVDNERVMGLKFDKDGIVSDVVYLDEFPEPLHCVNGYVEKAEGKHIVVDTNGLFRGLKYEYDLTDDIPVYYGSTDPNNPLVGKTCALNADAGVRLILDGQDRLKMVYAEPYREPGDIYWNVNRMWNSTINASTRTANVLGYYEILFAVNGKQVTLRTSDQNIVNAVDKNAASAWA